MHVFFKLLLIFTYFFIAFFIKPCETLAFHNAIVSLSNAKQEKILTEETEKYYALTTNNNFQIKNINNRNNSISLNGTFESEFDSNIRNHLIFDENKITNTRLLNKKSKYLKNEINTRAP